QGSWLERYAAEFPTVEVNATFYSLPRPSVVERWAQRVPDGFVFTVKVSRYLTHVRRLDDIQEGVERLSRLLVPLAEAGRLGPWAERIDSWARDGDVYAYFNNDWEAFAVNNARDLQRRLAADAPPAGGTRTAPGDGSGTARQPSATYHVRTVRANAGQGSKR